MTRTREPLPTFKASQGTLAGDGHMPLPQMAEKAGAKPGEAFIVQITDSKGAKVIRETIFDPSRTKNGLE